MLTRLLHKMMLLACLALPMGIQAQTDSLAATQPAEDFLIASVCVASPGEEIYSALGHACLRLQCPEHGLDYIYSYEAEDVTQNVLRFFMGNLKMTVRAIPTDEYLEQYAEQGRGVREYTINLPVRVKQRLWQRMDERLEYSPIPYDYMNHGCAFSVLQWLEDAIGADTLCYASWPEKYGRSRKEIGGDSIADAWNHIFVCSFVTGESNKVDIPNTQKVIVPSELVEVLQEAEAFGKQVLSEHCNVLLQPTKEIETCWFSPMLLALVVLLLSVSNCRLHLTLLRWTALVPSLLLGSFAMYLVCFSSLPCTEWNWLIVPFCPLPFLVWKYREYWCIPYSVVCLLWWMGMLVYPHQIVDDAHLVLALSMQVSMIEIYMDNKYNIKK